MTGQPRAPHCPLALAVSLILALLALPVGAQERVHEPTDDLSERARAAAEAGDWEAFGEAMGELGDSIGASVETAVESSVGAIDWQAFGESMGRLGATIGASVGGALAAVDWEGLHVDARLTPEEKARLERELERLERDLERLERDLERDVEQSLRAIDWQALERDIEAAVDSVDWDRIGAEIERAVEEATRALEEIDIEIEQPRRIRE